MTPAAGAVSPSAAAGKSSPLRPMFTRLPSSSFSITGTESLGDHEEEEQDEQQHASSIPKTATWQSVGLLMIADVVGAGVMTLATAFAELGWVLGFISLIFWYVCSMYVGLLIQTAHEAYPECENFMQLGRAAFGRKCELLTGLCVYVFIFFVLGDYVLILGETLEMMTNTAETTASALDAKCTHLYFSFIACLLLLPLSMIRLLGNTTWFMLINAMSILFSVGVAFLGVALDRAQNERTSATTTMEPIRTELLSSTLTVYSFFHAQALFAFAFSGAYIYLEIISEMKDPREFRKSLLILAGPFQFLVYLIAGSVGYHLFGVEAKGLLIKMVPFGPSYQVAAFMLAVHMVLTFLVKGTIMSRAIHAYCFPESAKDFKSWHAQRVFMLVCAVMIVGCFFVANLVPFFDDLTSLLGAMNAPWIGYVLPILFAVKARKVLGYTNDTHCFERICMWVICFFMVLLFVFGVLSSFTNIISKWSTYGKPFAGCL